ncbi:X-ray repair cross-complementing protein 5 [Toxocara canis]|uniref:ATP-dependent DNA helicase 2 subunit 1 n=1 Tax=Toxocara canis TaxID=6265 RepID=A0A0B2W3Y8_TOXCA|nr:X-ray repair cross-complementing protein 5 [Toxocara canis]
MADDDFDDEDFEGAYLLSDAGKKCTIFLVDGAPKMFEKYQHDGEDDSPDCAFRRALEIIRLQLVNKAVTSSSGEYTAIMFINTTNGSHNVDNVVVWQDVDLVNAERVKQVDSLLKSDDLLSTFTQICGGHGKCDYSEVLFLCIKRVTTHTPTFQKRVVYLFTNESNPFGSSKQHMVGAAKNADDLRKHGAEFAIFPLLSEDEEFGFEFNSLEQLDPDVRKHCDNIAELEEDIPRKQYARRNISSIDFSLSSDVKLSVGIYSLIRSEKMPRPIALDAERNEIVQRSFIYTNKKTGEEMPLFDKEITRHQEVGGARVNMTAEEIEKLRRLTPPGLVLLGFKPISALKLSHHVRSSQYVYPLETQTLGSTRLYRALLEVCESRKKIIICRYTQKENTPPKLVALVPQSAAERKDDSKSKANEKFRYPGFHLVYMPFLEDKRDLSEQMSHPDGDWPKSNEEQVEAARNVIRKLTLNYFPEKFSNPVIQKHYKVIEAMALDLDEVPQVEDQIQPYFAHEAFTKRVRKELDEFRSITLPDDYNPEAKKTSKGRKADSTSSSKFHSEKEAVKGKKMKYDEMSLEQLANNQQLKSLTVAQLKVKAAEVGIAVKASAKKNDVIEAIEHFYGIA